MFDFGHDTDDADSNESAVARVPDTPEDATIRGDQSWDVIGTTINDLDASRVAKGTVDGYDVKLELQQDAVESEFIIHATAYATNDVTPLGDSVNDPFPRPEFRHYKSIPTRTQADALFNELVDRYDLTEREFGHDTVTDDA